ncbi:hypothetical protein [Alkalihalobacterium elongatum]|uniref:hypothetical protein n=1 Tax=Alkalihalobacterium elongatum TaxID=2675466 RepID=UPI001C1F92EC|nr:hypothetical protein [Alkalihalobacterium elongatum]
MSRILIRTGFVNQQVPGIKQNSTKVSEIRSRVSSVSGSLDRRITVRRGIGSRLNRTESSLGKLEMQVKNLQTFVNQSMARYAKAESFLASKGTSVERLGKGHVYAGLMGRISGFGAYANNIRKTMVEAGSNAHVVGATYQREESVLHKFFSGVGKVGDALNFFDTPLLVSNALTIATAAGVTSTLKINYRGGRPSLMDRIKGNYRFTVAAADSWTSKGHHSNPIARKIKDFANSKPTNPILKGVHKAVSSYSSPSHLIKHVAGFAKDTNFAISMTGKDILDHTKNRMKDVSTKGVLEKAATAKGFTNLGKGIPLIGNVVTIGSNATEFTNAANANKGGMEKTGRFFGGALTDFGAVAAGASAGAKIGAFAGPKGVIIGGAVGGLVGGVANNAFVKDVAKDVGGAIGRGAENIGKAIGESFGGAAEGLANKFKSVTSWLN